MTDASLWRAWKRCFVLKKKKKNLDWITSEFVYMGELLAEL